MSSPGLEICKEREGYATALPNGDCVAYWDKAGQVWTIGSGVTGPDVKKGVRWTRTYAEARLLQEWEKHQQGVLRASPILRSAVHANRLEAVTDFAYNLGVGRYQSSTLRRYVDQSRWSDASNEFPKWNLAGGKVQPGLVLRRSKERALFLLPSIPIPALKSSDITLAVPSEHQSSSSSNASHSDEDAYEALIRKLQDESPSFSTRLGAVVRRLFERG